MNEALGIIYAMAEFLSMCEPVERETSYTKHMIV